MCISSALTPGAPGEVAVCVTVGSEEEDDMLSLHLNYLRIAQGLRTWAFQLRGRWGEILVPVSVTGHGAAVQ